MSAGLAMPTLPAGPFQLRPFRLADLDLVREAAQDPHIPLITTVPASFSAEAGRQFIERQWSRAELGAGYSFAIAEAAMDRAVGQAGLWLRDISDGRRAAGHAVAAIARWAFGDLRIPRLELYVEPWNEASIRTAEYAGFSREGLLRSWEEVGGVRKDMYMYSMLPADLPDPP